MSPPLELNCWVLGDDAGRIFPVKIAKNETIGALKEVIKDKKKPAFDHLTSDSLDLWKVNISVDAEINHKLRDLRPVPGPDNGVCQLLPVDELSEVFPEVPVRKHLHIVVQPPPPALPKRPRSPESDSSPSKRPKDDYAVQTIPELAAFGNGSLNTAERVSSGEIHRLWTDCWGRGTKESNAFELRSVCRDEKRPASEGVHVPSACWTLKVQPWINKLLGTGEDTTAFMIRKEYLKALDAVIECYQTGQDTFETNGNENAEIPEHDARDTFFENPFSKVLHRTKSTMPALVVLGQPGIGKTAWLHVVLVLRLCAGLPTFYQSQLDVAFFFGERGVFRYDMPHQVRGIDFDDIFHTSTWCLIDSNQSLTGVLQFMMNLQLFIVQAASPRASRIDWTNKAKTTRYYMKPWTLPELLTGRMLQAYPPSEADLETFYIKFGPSARLAYLHASKLSKYEANLNAKFSTITRSNVGTYFRQASSLTMSEEFSHQIILIEPGRHRFELRASPSTHYLYSHIRDVMSKNKLSGASTLYSLFLGNSATRASAGYALGDAIHDLFCKGGEWPIMRMEGNPPGQKYKHWRTPRADNSLRPAEGLRLYLGQHPEQWILIGSSLSKPAGTTAPLPFHPYHHREQLILRDGYYCPHESNEETLDAFIYEAATQTATVLQATAGCRHSVKEGTITWLRGLGVKNFRYIAVTPPETQLDLSFPKSLSEISDIYQLIMEKILPD